MLEIRYPLVLNSDTFLRASMHEGTRARMCMHTCGVLPVLLQKGLPRRITQRAGTWLPRGAECPGKREKVVRARATLQVDSRFALTRTPL